tara:strand:+ start:2025 stop:2171 length:147 start_codon:yes stop_codon:yes gene_type:complete
MVLIILFVTNQHTLAYPYENIFQNSLRIFYNGNGFGKTGFAELKLDEI